MNQRMRDNLRHVARGGWNRLGKESQHELLSGRLVLVDEYSAPRTVTITPLGYETLKEN